METKTFKPYLVIIGLLALTSLALAFTVDVKTVDEAGVRLELPQHVGPWVGQYLRFCQNPVCTGPAEGFLVGDLADPHTCPVCGGVLDSMHRSEKVLLPPDTEIVKKNYRNAAGQSIFVTIVLSGRERASIHRPQVCLVGQGYDIVKSSVVSIEMPGRDALGLMSLELMGRKVIGGRIVRTPEYFAYWFVGKGRETPHHGQRMIWMATDRIFHNISHRWAYIAVAGWREPDSDYKEQLQAFVRDFYPVVVL